MKKLSFESYNEALDVLSENLIALNQSLIKFYQQYNLHPSLHAFLRIYFRYVGFLMVESIGGKLAKTALVAAKDTIYQYTENGKNFAKISDQTRYSNPQERDQHLQAYLVDEPEFGTISNAIMGIAISIAETIQNAEELEPQKHSIEQMKAIESRLDEHLLQFAHSSYSKLTTHIETFNVEVQPAVFMLENFLIILGWLAGYVITVEGDSLDLQLEKYIEQLSIALMLEEEEGLALV